MKSFRQLYQRLPGEFFEHLHTQYEERLAEKILEGFMEERPVTLRVNTLKNEVREVMEALRRLGIKFERVLWYPDALIVRNQREKDLEATELYQEGRIYLQSLSSMLPPLALAPQPGLKVLDLTAAPGGKTTQLAALMDNRGFILANEINAIRAERLKYNVAKQGASIAQVRVGDGKWLDPEYQQFFDAVLLDAPCSGVGLFELGNSQTYRGWSVRNVVKLAKEQKKLLETAFWALKPGGSLVYSTCTLCQEENESVIAWALERFGDNIRLEELPQPLRSLEQNCLLPTRYPGKSIGIMPTALMEGFFVARFRKLA